MCWILFKYGIIFLMQKVIGAFLIFASLYLGIYLFDLVGILDIPTGQYSASANKAIEQPKEAEEAVFINPEEIEWSGVIFGVLQSGNGYAIRNLDKKAKYPEFMAFWPKDKIEWLEGSVKVIGTLEGIDCAYQNTVFGGNCVPFVTIKKIEKSDDN